MDMPCVLVTSLGMSCLAMPKPSAAPACQLLENPALSLVQQLMGHKVGQN